MFNAMKNKLIRINRNINIILGNLYLSLIKGRLYMTKRIKFEDNIAEKSNLKPEMSDLIISSDVILVNKLILEI